MTDILFKSDQLVQYSDFIRNLAGMDFDPTKWFGLKISLKERMKHLSINDPEDYLMHLKSKPAEQEELLSLLSVPETYFFRDKRQFDALRDRVFPQLLKKKARGYSGKPYIKIVSCGCSTGEEPYSLAIAALESGLSAKADIDIIAFDINIRSLAKANAAKYTKHSFREKDTKFLTQYFEQQGKNFILKDKVKKMVKFYPANLFDFDKADFLIDGSDILFFRNVSIYFNPQGVLHVLDLLADKVSKEGYLFLGSSESLLGKETRFKMEQIGGAAVCRPMDAVLDRTMTAEIPESVLPIIQTQPVESIPIPVAPAPIIVPKSQEKFQEKYKPAEDHFENALGYVQIKQIKKAEEEFKEQLKKTPQHVQSLVGLAEIYANTEREELAVSTCEQANAIDNLLTDSYFIMGLVHYKKGDFSESADFLKKAIYCEENHFLAQYYLGETYRGLAKENDANRQYRNTIKIIEQMGPKGVRQEITGVSAGYILSLCVDSLS